MGFLQNILAQLQAQSSGAPRNSSWATSHGLTSIEDKISGGVPLSAAEMNYLQQLSSVAPSGWSASNAGNQSQVWNDFVSRVQDRESGGNGGILGIKELGIDTGLKLPLIDPVAEGFVDPLGNQLGKTFALEKQLDNASGSAGLPQVAEKVGHLSNEVGGPIALTIAGANAFGNFFPGAETAGTATSGADDATLQSILNSSQTPTMSQGLNVADLGGGAQPLPASTAGVDAINSAAPGSIAKGLTNIAGTPFAPAAAGGLAGALPGSMLPNALTTGAAATATGSLLNGGNDPNADPNTNTNTNIRDPKAPITTDPYAPATPDVTNSMINGGANPVVNGAASGLGGMTLEKLLSGDLSAGDLASTVTMGDLSKVLGTIGATGLSIAGSNAQANALKDLNNQYMGITQPSRTRYEASMNPNFDINSIPGLQGAMDTSMQSILRGLSTHGNPWGNPGGLAEALKYATGSVALPALQNYRNQNAATGGYGAFSSAAPAAASGAINATGNIYSDLGRGISNLVNPPTSLEQALRTIKGLT